MRLLDLVAQTSEPFMIQPREPGSQPITVSGPNDFAAQLGRCPLRFVIADDLTRASAELAFADGDRLAGCLDLLRIPAPQLWIEWSDAVHQKVIKECGVISQEDPDAEGRRVGLLLRAGATGRTATARTFWSYGTCEAYVSPLETHIDLDTRFALAVDPDEMLAGGYASITHAEDAGVAELLERVRFRFDQTWLNYYRAVSPDAFERQTITRESLAAVARDIPLLMAFCLLLNANGATRRFSVERDIINRKRRQRDRAPLLDHIEVRACLPVVSEPSLEGTAAGTRRPPRLHHVRGHLVRREDRVFWRTPHLRGSARQGIVRSRTVSLSFGRTQILAGA
jgi:transposase